MPILYPSNKKRFGTMPKGSLKYSGGIGNMPKASFFYRETIGTTPKGCFIAFFYLLALCQCLKIVLF